MVAGPAGERRARYALWRVSLMLVAGATAVCLFAFVASAQAAPVAVTSAGDSGPGSLRAVTAAAGVGDTIAFDSSLNGQTIALTSGSIAIDKSLTIAGPGAEQLAIDADHGSQIFTISSGDFSISGLTLAEGAASETGGAVEQTGEGSLTVSDCAFTGNTAGGAGGAADSSNQGHGGAIYVSPASGPTSVTRSTFSANTVGGPGGTGFQSGLGSGGAIWDAGEALTVSGSTFTGNSAGGDGDGGTQSGNGAGGAIQKSGGLSLTVSGSDFSGNTAGGAGGTELRSGRGVGGAIYVSQPSGQSPSLTVVDSSFSDNEVGGVGGDGPASGTGAGGAIEYFSEGLLSVSGTTFEGNRAGGAGGAGGSAPFSPYGSGAAEGGAISVASASSATISESVFIANTAGGDGGIGAGSGRGEGGAMKNGSGGPLTISGSTFAHNTAGGRKGSASASGSGIGGAIDSLGLLAVHDSAFTANAAGGQGGSGEGAFGFGGAIRTFSNNGSLTVSGSTFAENIAGGQGGGGVGGAIDASSVTGRSAAISNTTLVRNEAGGAGATGRGGAIEVTDMTSVTLASVTIDENKVGSGGSGAGINSANGAISRAAAITAKATIVSGNSGAANCDAPVAVSSYSLEGTSPSDTSCGFDLLSADPLLEPLADNGGPTETEALPIASPAVDAVPVAKCPTKVDQRGEPRPDNGKNVCDVGAFELQDPPVAPAITSAAAMTFQVGRAGSFTVAASGLPTPALSVTGALPSGVSFADHGDGTASLSGTPTVGSGGSYLLTIKASNGALPDAEQSFALTVQAPPTASIATPVDGGTYTQGQAASSSFTCAEGVGGSGIASCLDQDGRPTGASLDTAAVGRHTLTVTAASKDGLTSRTSASYTVVAPTPTPPRPRVLISYRQEGGLGGSRPSLVIFKDREAKVRLGGCTASFELRQKAWKGLRVAIRVASLRANAGTYPAPKGSADLITHVVKARGVVVRITLPQPEHKAVVRDLRPLLKVLDRLASAGERRMPASCSRNR